MIFPSCAEISQALLCVAGALNQAILIANANGALDDEQDEQIYPWIDVFCAPAPKKNKFSRCLEMLILRILVVEWCFLRFLSFWGMRQARESIEPGKPVFPVRETPSKIGSVYVDFLL
jgi:hypothetical protein